MTKKEKLTDEHPGLLMFKRAELADGGSVMATAARGFVYVRLTNAAGTLLPFRMTRPAAAQLAMMLREIIIEDLAQAEVKFQIKLANKSVDAKAIKRRAAALTKRKARKP